LRILSTAVLVGLLVATAAAFAVTERLKLTKSLLTGPKVTAAFSPVAHTDALISIRFRRADRVTVTVQDAHRHLVDTLAAGVRLSRGRHAFLWNGLDSGGARVPDGTYRAQIHLAQAHRTILLPNPIVLDTTLPEVTDARAIPSEFSPDGDHQADKVSLHYSLSKPAHVVVFAGGHRVVRGRSHQTKGKVDWNGTVDGELLPPGTYVLTIGAVDVAGNRTPTAEDAHVRVQLRYIALANRRITGVGAGKRFQIGVSTDAKRYRWTLGKRSGVAGGSVLTLRAPSKRGTYRLTVREHGHLDRALVVVR
jgi:flagellar hook assembly protein FlgD